LAILRSLLSTSVNQFYLKDYQHASKTFLNEPGYVMTPKHGFNFHARLNFNPPGQSQNGEQSKTISVLVKNVELPKFNLQTQILNKYNKKEVIHTKIDYDPINLTFHDDKKNTIRDLWLAYNNYYFADASVTPEAWGQDDTYLQDRLFNRYGLDNNQDEKLIKSLDVYSMGNHVYTKYSFINPLIASFNFDTHDYSEGSKVMEARLRIEYETVLYYEGNTENIPGFGKNSPYYDNQFSTLGLAGDNISSRIIDAIEESIALVTNRSQIDEQTRQFNDKVTTQQIPVSNAQLNLVKAIASDSLANNRSFSFPSAQSLSDLSSLVSLNAKTKASDQGRIASSGGVVSNGSAISNSPPSRQGTQFSSATNTSKLIVNPKVPSNLTTTELIAFYNAYPPLSTTDPRTRMPPYV